MDAPVAVAAPLTIEGPDSENSSSDEEDQPLGESSSGEDPENQSSKDSSNEDGPPPDDQAFDPYDQEQGHRPTTAEEVEEKLPEKAARTRGRPRVPGDSSSKRGRGK